MVELRHIMNVGKKIKIAKPLPKCINCEKILSHVLAKRCLQCASIHKYKYQSQKKELKEKLCIRCNNAFMPTNHNQGLCKAPCGAKVSEQDKWLNKKEGVSKLSEAQIAYGFFRKKASVKTSYKPCRG
jgi:hypothetical protein